MPLCRVTLSRTTKGNNVPKSNKKTRKVIKNSAKDRRFKSEILGVFLKIKCTKRADDTIVKHGGIDLFLMNTINSKLSPDMLALKKKMQKSMKVRKITLSPEDLLFKIEKKLG